MLFSATCVGAYAVVNHVPFDPFRISWDRLQLVYLFADYLLLSLPFFFCGLCVSGVLTHFANEAGKIYFFDLAGAGAGSVLILFVFVPFGGKGAILIPAGLGALGALVLGVRRPASRWAVVVSLLLLGSLATLAWIRPSVLDVRMSPFKSLEAALRYPGGKVLDTYWNAYSRVDVVDSPLVRFAPGLSLVYQQSIPSQIGLTIDGDHLTAITRYDPHDPPVAFLSHMPDALAYHVMKVDRALVIDPGGGLGVLMGQVLGARKVDVVFGNSLVFEALSERYESFAGGILRDPRVNAVVMGSRSFIRQTANTYDVIQYSPLTSLGASSTGIHGLYENYMFTVEAITDLFGHLRPGGVFSITQYLLPPPRQEIRLVHLVLEALGRMGISEPERHIAAIRSWGTFTLLLKRTPLSDSEIQAIKSFSRRNRFDTVHFPGMTQREANRFNRFPRPIYFEMVQNLLADARREQMVREYLFDLRPVTDDRPFFFNFFRFKKTIHLYKSMRNKWQPFLEGGYLVPVVLIESIIASILLIILPLVFGRRSSSSARQGSRFSNLAYFALLGWGYMFVEIVLIQKLILVLDHPVYAMTTVISALLVSSGLGSLVSQRMREPRLRITLVVIVPLVGCLVLGYLWLIPVAIERLLGLGLVCRELMTVTLLFPLGFFMGMPFPLGIRLLKQIDPDTIPWAWCANSCFSVMGAVLSVVLALGIGFSWVLFMAGAVYLAAAAVVSVAFLHFTDHRNKHDIAHVPNI
jgi:hypothetical protein